jgi:hypothetical protein
MLFSLDRNALDRVPSRTALVPSVTPWQTQDQRNATTQPSPDTQCEPESSCANSQELECDPSVETLTPIPSNDMPLSEFDWANEDWDSIVDFRETGPKFESMPRYYRPWTPWSGDSAELIAWYWSIREQLPKQEYRLSVFSTIVDPQKYYSSLEADIKRGASGTRLVGLIADLHQLVQKFSTLGVVPEF